MTCADDAAAIRRLDETLVDGLSVFLAAIERDFGANWFTPHPFDREYLLALCEPARRDLHYVLVAGRECLCYGMLRGWDEGYEYPSLGIATQPARRAIGSATAMMGFLHVAATLRRSPRIRLRVARQNDAAIKLYRRFGYVFQDDSDDELLVGWKTLLT